MACLQFQKMRQLANMANMNRYKLEPPFFNGDYGTFEEGKYKFTAYMGLQDNDYTDLLQAAERGHSRTHRDTVTSSGINNRRW